MAELRCPNCGRNNPDFLDTCQFCQSELRADSTLHTGVNPVKMNTGELEPILPQWLKEVRQQARESAAEDAAHVEQTKVRKNEPPDLLAGLASQKRDDDEQVPDWLAAINPPNSGISVKPAAEETSLDFFAQFEQNETAKPAPPADAHAQEEMPPWMAESPGTPRAGEEKDELSEWFAKASAEPSEHVEIESDEPNWADSSVLPPISFKEPEPKKEEEDLGWLHALEDSTKQPAASVSPQTESKWEPESQSSSGEDLSWLDQLGGATGFDANIAEPAQPASSQPATEPQEDLAWLNNLGGIPESNMPEKATVQPTEPGENLDWLNALGAPRVDSQQSPASQPAESEQPAIVSPFVPRRTGPLEEGLDTPMPDWLKSATEEPLMPAPGALSDWFREEEKATPATFDSYDQTEGMPASPASTDHSGEDVDSLFSVEMPDWLARPEPGTESPAAPQKESIPFTPGDDSISPVDLPSWVQAMRPVESVISDASSVENQPTEREGPLAGLRGVIPVAPIGSSRRPKAISLKLQASDEHQSAATLLEQVLASEENPRPLVTSAFVASQRTLRWALSGLFVLVLGAMLFLRTQSMPISAALPPEVSGASSAVTSLPFNSSVLVVIDYEPALAGEMEAVSGPLLDQLVLSNQPNLTFISTSPNSSALVERLLANTKVNTVLPGGLIRNNLGYLPGGASGILAFIESPKTALPSAANVDVFSQFAAVIVLTDHAESGRVWVEQLDARKQLDPSLANQRLILAASAQAGPLLEPYFSSGQVAGLVNGLADAARYEFVNGTRPGIARTYWDSFGIGLLMAVVAITLGSLWSLVTGIRARRAEVEFG